MHDSEDADAAVVLVPLERQPAEKKPMEGVESNAPDVSMRNAESQLDPALPLLSTDFHPPTNRTRHERQPVFLLENGTDAEEERKKEGCDGSPTL